jgi:hypothetical protein
MSRIKVLLIVLWGSVLSILLTLNFRAYGLFFRSTNGILPEHALNLNDDLLSLK